MLIVAAKLLLALVLAVVLILLIFAVIGKHRLRPEEPGRELSDWMRLVSDDTPINAIAVPGSHDAGTTGVVWAAETQHCNIDQQLRMGVRYFDLRVHKKGDEYVMFHSIADGMDFKTVLSWIESFISEHTSEFLYLDFQHFKGDSQADVFRMLTEHLHDKGLVVENDTDKSDIDFLRGLTLGDVRGKCLILWGDVSSIPAKYIFPRNTDECTLDDMCADSYYISQLHRQSPDVLISRAHPVYFERLGKLKEQNKNCIFVLQCQLTDGLIIRGPWSREKINDPVISEYIKSLASGEKLGDINIIMRDFLTVRKCVDIIDLNYCKGIMARSVLTEASQH